MNNTSKLINALEIIYSLLLAVGLYDTTISLNSNNIIKLLCNLLFIGLCILILMRFFFAPSKNIALIIKAVFDSSLSLKKKKDRYRQIMLLDVPILFAHAVLYIKICKPLTGINKLINCQLFFFYFALLLCLNTIWLTWIKERIEQLKHKSPPYITFWANNNFYTFLGIILFLGLLFFSSDYNYEDKSNFNWSYLYIIMLLVLAYTNCLLDLWKTYKAYFFNKL